MSALISQLALQVAVLGTLSVSGLAAPELPRAEFLRSKRASTDEPQEEPKGKVENKAPVEAARAALKEAPRRSKIGKLRGLQATSEVRFASAPSDPYQLVTSFGIPDRARVDMSNQNGSFRRFQLGARLFGRDSKGTQPSTSFELTGGGLQESLIDIELRRALFLWPDAPRFTGAGRTYTSKLGDFGVLMATVNEETGLPTKIQTYGKDGGAGAEFNAIEWTAATETTRAQPTSFTFAAGGQTIWTETVEGVQYDWRFADTWFVPSDCLAGVMGSQVADKMHVRAVEGAWIHRVPIADLKPAKEGPRIGIADAIQLAAKEWNNVRKRPELNGDANARLGLAPNASIVLDPMGDPWAVEFEATGATQEEGPASRDWRRRKPSNVWAFRLATPKLGGPIEGFGDATKALGAIYAKEQGLKPLQRLRFRIGEERLNGKVRAIGVDLVLHVDVPANAPSDPKEATSEGTKPGKR